MSEIPIVPVAQWVVQQGSEALGTGSNRNIYLFLLLIWFWVLKIVFLLLSKLFSTDFSSPINAESCRNFLPIFFIINNIFKIATNFLFSWLFSPAYFFKACKCSLCQAQANTRKHQNFLFRKSSVSVTQRILTKNRDTPVTHSSSIPETLRNTNRAPHEFFLETKSFWHLFVIPTSMAHQNLRTR